MLFVSSGLIHPSISISALFIYYIFQFIQTFTLFIFHCSCGCCFLLCGLYVRYIPSNFYFVEYTIRCDSWYAGALVCEVLFYHFVFAIKQHHRNQSNSIHFSYVLFSLLLFHLSISRARTSTFLLSLLLLCVFSFRYCVSHHFSLTPSICKMIDFEGFDFPRLLSLCVCASFDCRTHNDRVIHE